MSQSKNRKNDDKEQQVSQNPIEWLFHAALLVLGTVVALTFALQLLAAIWPWLVGIGLLVGGGWVAGAVARARRRDW